MLDQPLLILDGIVRAGGRPAIAAVIHPGSASSAVAAHERRLAPAGYQVQEGEQGTTRTRQQRHRGVGHTSLLRK